MIDPDAEPIGHLPVYKRIDPSHPGRRAFIPALEIVQNGGRYPDSRVYRFAINRDGWELIEGS